MKTNNQSNEVASKEQPQKRKRTRIPSKKFVAIPDSIDYKKNRCVNSAIFSNTVERGYQIELWFAKHYHERHFKGDENGKRHGIEPQVVQSLVERSLKHLFHYSAMYSSFKLINFPGQIEPRTAAVVLQEFQSNGQLLNVVVEIHLIDICKYEITVKTAMCDDEFNLFQGQYVVEIEEDTSVLKRYINSKLVTI